MRTSFGSSILDAACRLPVPFIALFAVYVVIHGHDSPGGGFQGGAILAATLILIRMVRGTDDLWGVDRTRATILACCGVGLFAGIGLLTIVFGRQLSGTTVHCRSHLVPEKVRFMGSLGIEIGVALAVTGVLVLIFDALTEGDMQESDDGE